MSFDVQNFAFLVTEIGQFEYFFEKLGLSKKSLCIRFCFDSESHNAAAVDFQYVGHGCAMKDVALFMSSAVRPQDCEELESEILEAYFRYLKEALTHYQPQLSFDDVEAAWSPMFYVAWADFQRFVKGWSPEHWKINPYTEQLTQTVIEQLESPE